MSTGCGLTWERNVTSAPIGACKCNIELGRSGGVIREDTHTVRIKKRMKGKARSKKRKKETTAQ